MSAYIIGTQAWHSSAVTSGALSTSRLDRTTASEVEQKLFLAVLELTGVAVTT